MPVIERADIDALAARHGIIRTFRAAFMIAEPATAHVIDAVRKRIGKERRVTGHSIEDQVIKRVRFDDASGAYRAATWWQRDAHTVWLCRVSRISDFTDEGALYRAFADQHARGLLLPTDVGRQTALTESVVEGALASLAEALNAAGAHPDRWVEAQDITLPDGSNVPVGAAYIEIVEEADGSIQQRTLLAVRTIPIAGAHPAVVAQAARISLSDSRGPRFEATYEIPVGRQRRPDEVPLRQELVLDQHGQPIAQ